MIRTGIAFFDSVAGGLLPEANHLLYGELGAGKSTFALQFLYRGLSEGEPALLVTRRIGADVLAQAEAFGVSLGSFVRSGKLTLLEYAPDVVERAARAKDISPIADEFDYFARERRVRRMVFDPLTPIVQGMSISETSFRVRSLIQRLAKHRATTLFLLDLPEAAEMVASCKDVVQAVLRFDVGEQGGTGTLVLERMPGATEARRRISYALDAGRGLVEALPEVMEAAEGRRRKVLVASNDPATLGLVRQLLAEDYDLTECQDALQAVARLAAESADLLLIDADLEAENAVRACLELRRNQLNLPILLVSARYKRLRDRLGLLAEGIDDCLEKPVDSRLLRVRVRALLKRYSRRERFQPQETDAGVLASLERPVPASPILQDVAAVRANLQMEVEYARKHSLPFSVCILEVAAAQRHAIPQALEAIQRLIRPHDKIYASDQAITVLLSETSEGGLNAFLRRAQAETGSTEFAQIRSFTFDGSEDFVPRVLRVLVPESGSASGVEKYLEVT